MYRRCVELPPRTGSSERRDGHRYGHRLCIRLVGQPGLEPGTSVLSGLRSNRLSYWPTRASKVHWKHYTTHRGMCADARWGAWLLLGLIGFSTIESAIPRTPRCRPFFELAGRPTLVNIYRREPMGNRDATMYAMNHRSVARCRARRSRRPPNPRRLRCLERDISNPFDD